MASFNVSLSPYKHVHDYLNQQKYQEKDHLAETLEDIISSNKFLCYGGSQDYS